ncbi:phage holin family protein [Labilithrix luteola]|nr:phage holin family protein [Labilithrix luteola]
MQKQLFVTLGHLLVSGVSVFIAAKLMPGMRAKSFGSALGFALTMAVLNAVAWHFLAPLTITLSVLTFGIGALVVNGVLFLVAGKISGVEFSGCIVAALASLVVTFVNWAIEYALAGWPQVR